MDAVVPIGDAPVERVRSLPRSFRRSERLTASAWDWTSNPEEPFAKIKGYHRLPIQHLAHADASGADESPGLATSRLSRVRCGDIPDWMDSRGPRPHTLLAESGSARKGGA